MPARLLAFVLGAWIALPAWAQEAPLTGSAPPPPRPEAAADPADEVPPSLPQGENASPAGEGIPPVRPAPADSPPAWQDLAEDAFSFRSCLFGLSMLGVGYQRLGPITSAEDRDCGMARPLRVTEVAPGVAIAGGAEMRCATALHLALWLRNEAQPAVRHLPGAPSITALLPGSTYQCRARVGGNSQKLSAHALGDAIDISGLRLSSGAELMIKPRSDTGGIEEAVQKALRFGACLYFTTVLGPGSNAEHDEHLHFDMVARKGGWRLCE